MAELIDIEAPLAPVVQSVSGPFSWGYLILLLLILLVVLWWFSKTPSWQLRKKWNSWQAEDGAWALHGYIQQWQNLCKVNSKAKQLWLQQQLHVIADFASRSEELTPQHRETLEALSKSILQRYWKWILLAKWHNLQTVIQSWFSHRRLKREKQHD